MQSSEPKGTHYGSRSIFEDVELCGRTKQFNSKRNDERVRYVAGPRKFFRFSNFCNPCNHPNCAAT